MKDMTLVDQVNHYEVLNIAPSATSADIREAYQKVKSAYQQDSVVLYSLISNEEREEALRRIDEAYLILSDPDRRKNYDKTHELLGYQGEVIPPALAAPEEKEISSSLPTLEEEDQPPLRGGRYRIKPLSVDLLAAVQAENEWSGPFLKKVREESAMPLEEMADITKVSRAYLTAIEDENFVKLPAAVFVRGFVIQIAKILKLPHEKVATAYLKRYYHARGKPE